MTAFTVRISVMVKGDTTPVFSTVMAVAALTWPVPIWRGMAPSAGVVIVVGENNGIPIGSCMAFRTLGIVVMVITRRGMAGVTLVETGVIKINIWPGGGIVALDALVSIMVGWNLACMAWQALSDSIMIEIIIGPVFRIRMANRAYVAVMVGWGFAGVALFTIGKAGVVEGVIRPGGGVMALGARIPVVICWGFF
jgi:hypothetical protein